MRRSPRLSATQQRAWDEYQDRFVVPVPRHLASTSIAPDYRIDPAELFGRQAPLTVEVGSGLGEAVVNAAQDHPERDFLALEVYLPGIASTLRRMGQRGLSNIRLIQANAPEVLQHALPEASVHELWVFFPDPWHKKRHHKRRLVTTKFLDLAARVLQDEGTLRIATDWADYAEQISQVLAIHPKFARDPKQDSQRFAGRVLTSFERKAQTAGREVTDFTYRRLPRNE